MASEPKTLQGAQRKRFLEEVAQIVDQFEHDPAYRNRLPYTHPEDALKTNGEKPLEDQLSKDDVLWMLKGKAEQLLQENPDGLTKEAIIEDSNKMRAAMNASDPELESALKGDFDYDVEVLQTAFDIAAAGRKTNVTPRSREPRKL